MDKILLCWDPLEKLSTIIMTPKTSIQTRVLNAWILRCHSYLSIWVPSSQVFVPETLYHQQSAIYQGTIKPFSHLLSLPFIGLLYKSNLVVFQRPTQCLSYMSNVVRKCSLGKYVQRQRKCEADPTLISITVKVYEDKHHDVLRKQLFFLLHNKSFLLLLIRTLHQQALTALYWRGQKSHWTRALYTLLCWERSKSCGGC